MATVSYGLKITEAYHIFDKTIAIYRNAVHYISDIAMRHYDELKSLESITGDDGNDWNCLSTAEKAADNGTLNPFHSK